MTTQLAAREDLISLIEPMPHQMPLYSYLMAAGPDRPNKSWLARILDAQRSTGSALPLHLGLEPDAYRQLINCFFPDCRVWLALHYGHDLLWQRGELRQQLLVLRREEWETLRNLLVQHRRGDDASEIRMAEIVAAACLGSGHLWRDLGLGSRGMLRDLLQSNFPALVSLNTRDMRWKRFFYKQLCEQEGGYVCRSPSCDQCSTYDECFGEEN
ncbi:MAG: nitrogen fixation protein NifQ [Fluviicoccus sp.]|uniref:nitrogen fixation protein NifQ n=1 Tax=Fluviicoccus sp. TaxID=2003552 RepID=UPI002720DA5A|nr:nitrogen fixation protein NifQ [Fluviicoccus sp.]MDO8329450.1 nitrogen fixation protein NifQ [Fluviicoccus sp.]